MSLSDYFHTFLLPPFVVVLKDRSWSTEEYRYGFNGQEKEIDLTTTTTHNFGSRIYSSNLGRFLSMDDQSSLFSPSSTYSFAQNWPIIARDFQGDSIWVTLEMTERTLENGDKEVIKNFVIHTTIQVLDLTNKVQRNGGGCSGMVSETLALADEIEKEFNNIQGTWRRVVDLGNGKQQITNEHIRVEASVSVANSMDEVDPTSHLVVLVGDVLGSADPALGGGEAGGLGADNGQIAYVEVMKQTGKTIRDKYYHTIVATIHEWGHNAGFDHVPDVGNYMSYGLKSFFGGLQLTILANGLYNSPEYYNLGSNSSFSTVDPLGDFNHMSTNEEPWIGDIDKGDKIPRPLKNAENEK